VYDFAHIGNLRTYIFEDLLKRALTYLGYTVRHAMNITDVGHLVGDGDEGEDKMDKGAKREGKHPLEIARTYEEQFFKDAETLNILPPHALVQKCLVSGVRS
jgi:cysteinyl-tRNA synthetase